MIKARSLVAKLKVRALRVAVPVAVGAGALMVSGTASAQFTPDTMDAIVFPITLASIVEATVGAGAAVLVLVFAWKGGFKMVWKLLSRLLKAV